ncbi:hypothetical protein Esti_006050 [Eimeria stiedai]
MKNQLAQTAHNITELQQSWIKKQTELISIHAKIGERREELAAKKDELLVRKQRNIRVIGEVDSAKRDIKALHSELKDLQHLVDRMGRQLAAFKQAQAKFESDAAAVQRETEVQLAERSERKQEILINLEMARKERDETLEELVSLERQVMLWERKITLEKEMQSAIDPSSELTAMRKEIHRMELREAQLKKIQEQLLHQLDQVLSKRDMIEVRNEPKAREPNEAHQKVVLQRQLTSLDVKLREAEEQAAKAEKTLENATEDLSEVCRKFQATTHRANACSLFEKPDYFKSLSRGNAVRVAFENACFIQLQEVVRKLAKVTDEEIKTQLKASENNCPSVALALQKVQSEAASVGAALDEAEQQGLATLKPALSAFKAWALHLVSADSIYNLQPLALRTV